MKAVFKVIPSHPKRLMNKGRQRFVSCRLRSVALYLANKQMAFPIGRSERRSQAWHDVGALLVGVRAIPAISPYHLAIRTGRICAQVKQKEYGHGAFPAPQFGQSSKR